MAVKCPKCHFENAADTRFCGNCAAPLAEDDRLPDSLTKTLTTPIPIISKDTLIAGKYRVLDEIGQGGMGVVYMAEDIKLKRSVALKFLPQHLMHSPELKERFLVEAQAAAALSHANICVIHEVGEEEDRSFIAMEFVEGETLRDKTKKGPLATEEAVAIAVQVAAGLGEAHRKGIIHRDIKSANIMVTDKGQAKVMDFGLAKLRGGTSLTKSQTTLGTVAYMSPEQARGDELDQRTDTWSLGVVLYEMLTGELPFKGDHDQIVIHSILHREPKPLSKMRPGLPSGLEEIVLQALAKVSGERYQTMDEFQGDLEAVAEGLKPLKARPAKRKIFGIRKIYAYAGLGLVVVLFALNVGGLRNRLLGRAGRTERAVKMAVLPFVNLSGDPEQEYLSDGLTQEMIAQLGRLHPQTLSVIARTSVMRYKKTETPIDRIGRELGVEYVLEGSAQREAGRVRIAAELIQVRGQTQLWADTYERDMSGILALQSEVAGKVASALALKLLPAEKARLANVKTVHPEAYEAYIKGLQHWYKLTPAGLDASQQYFELALEKDPDYALPYAGIALLWAGRQQFGLTPPSEATPKAKAAALRAVSLDDSAAVAHYALAVVKAWSDWDWAGAESEFKRAIELDPSFPDARIYYAHLLNNLQRPEEAVAQGERSLELDPLNSLFRGLFAAVLLYARRYDDAIAQGGDALRSAPDDPLAHNLLWFAYFLKGMHKEGLAAAKVYLKGVYADPDVEKALDGVYAQDGYRNAMRAAAEALTAHFHKSYASPLDIAYLYVGAGERDRVLEWLEKGYELRDPNTPYIGMPYFDSLRSDPRFQDLLRRMKLPELK
ncbi:MAG: hypothetical protein A2Y75_10160 [Candidatus Solincola sediminis]|uniref:non-specific serine/threonine protein kinase n=1 Tax=Candidatus Solincola sediminis TaxID=1797199 RepID=A0A1F2WRQ4_9ACTN|nr:MAG: hypothetical protein A2Y75_10160 [Candidatus Solincola sediminis]